MINFRDLLKSENITDLSVLDPDIRAWIKDYEALEKAKLPTVRNKETGELTPNAKAKLDRLNKTIVKEIAEYVAERDAESDAAAETERLRLEAEQVEQDKLKKEQDDAAAEQERIRLAEEEKTKKKPGLFSNFFD
jgi:hypothetical protein